MKQYTDAIRQALERQNWLAALTIALSLPDICGGLETPHPVGSRERAARWFDDNMLAHYTIQMPVEPKLRTKERQAVSTAPFVFLGGSDCFALRCALLHEGSGQTDRHWARKALEDFQFVVHAGKARYHCNKSGAILQLDLKIFCSQMADAVDAWTIKVANDSSVQAEIARLLKITYL